MARKVGFYLQELIYWAALTKSNELAREKGTYGSYNRSWVQRGKLQMDLYVQEGNKLAYELSPFWDALRPKIAQDGIRNSLLICLMPTASTSTITGFSPSFEPHMGMYYTRKNNSTETMIVNKNLVRLLKRLNLWNSSVSTTILADKYGGISQIKTIPEDIRRVYRTVWEMDPHAVVEYCKTISPFIDQSMSMNLFVEKPDFNTLINIYLNGWTGGLKSGSYYCRSKAQYDADKTVVDKDIVICESCQ
jgi:ribonucleotide reductase alpha subunit